MKLKLNKKVIKNISLENNVIDDEMTPQYGGGNGPSFVADTCDCGDTAFGCNSEINCATTDECYTQLCVSAYPACGVTAIRATCNIN